MNQTQINTELAKIRRNALTLNEYLRMSRAGETFSMTRTDRKTVYGLYLTECEKHEKNRAHKRATAPTDAGRTAYNAITRERDEIALATA